MRKRIRDSGSKVVTPDPQPLAGLMKSGVFSVKFGSSSRDILVALEKGDGIPGN